LYVFCTNITYFPKVSSALNLFFFLCYETVTGSNQFSKLFNSLINRWGPHLDPSFISLLLKFTNSLRKGLSHSQRKTYFHIHKERTFWTHPPMKYLSHHRISALRYHPLYPHTLVKTNYLAFYQVSLFFTYKEQLSFLYIFF